MTRDGSKGSQGNDRTWGLEDEGSSHSPGHPDQSKLNKYLEAARSTNTEIATANAIKHYREVYKGPFPCTPHDLSLYLSHYAGTLKVATLEQRRSLIGKWHEEMTGSNPNKSKLVLETMRGIRKFHNASQKQANALPLDTLRETVSFLADKRNRQEGAANREWRRYSRDRAMLLTAFWFGLRGSELVNIRLSHLTFDWRSHPPKLTVMIPTSKADRSSSGREVTLVALSELCPIYAISEWIEDRFGGLDIGSETIKDQFLFSKVDRWGAVWSDGLNSNSINKILKRVFDEARENGAHIPEHFSSHSMRRGVSDWLIDQGASWSQLMHWVGWRDVRSARKYVDSKESLPSIFMDNNQRLSVEQSNKGKGEGQPSKIGHDENR